MLNVDVSKEAYGTVTPCGEAGVTKGTRSVELTFAVINLLCQPSTNNLSFI